jgi:hypothetical protein
VRDHPIFDLLERDFGPKFDESPWSPEHLEAPDLQLPPPPMAYLLPRLAALSTPTQVMEVISDEQ